jgi:hypothetical protein
MHFEIFHLMQIYHSVYAEYAVLIAYFGSVTFDLIKAFTSLRQNLKRQVGKVFIDFVTPQFILTYFFVRSMASVTS